MVPAMNNATHSGRRKSVYYDQVSVTLLNSRLNQVSYAPCLVLLCVCVLLGQDCSSHHQRSV